MKDPLNYFLVLLRLAALELKLIFYKNHDELFLLSASLSLTAGVVSFVSYQKHTNISYLMNFLALVLTSITIYIFYQINELSRETNEELKKLKKISRRREG